MTNDESTAKKVEAFAAEGKGAREIADALAISRQRVYQIAKTYGITIPASKRGPAALSLAERTKPRVQTGGVAVPINQTVAGTISELLVAADLMARGWQVFMPIIPSKGHDLIAMNGDRLVTVEVRSAYRNAAGTLKFAKKPDCASEVYALVVTGEPVIYQPDIERGS